MKLGAIFIILLVVFMPISFAKEVIIKELFEVPIIPITGSLEHSEKEIYYYAGSKLMATYKGELKYKYQDSSGSDINSKSLPFGQPIKIDERFSFTGKELDSDLYYFSARYYDSNLGQFSSIDPIKENPAYAYVNNNPMNFVDPNGMEPALKSVFYTHEAISSHNIGINTLSLGEFTDRGAYSSFMTSGSRSMPYTSVVNGNQRVLYLNTHGAPFSLQGISVWRTINAINRNSNIEYVGCSACYSTQTAARINLFTGRPALGYMGTVNAWAGQDTYRDFGRLFQGKSSAFQYTAYGKTQIGMVFANRGTSGAYLGLSGAAAILGYAGLLYFSFDTIKSVAQAEGIDGKSAEVGRRTMGLTLAIEGGTEGAALGAAWGSSLGPLGLLGGGLLGGAVGGGLGYFGGSSLADGLMSIEPEENPTPVSREGQMLLGY
jgi:RHS repeat-associated protein